MKLIAAAPWVLGTVPLLWSGCGDDEPTSADDASITASDGSRALPNDGGIWWPELPLDGGEPPIDIRGDAQSPSDAGTQQAADSGPIVNGSADSGVGPTWILQQTCPPSRDSNPCYACEEEHCCESYARYDANPEAIAYKQCFQACVGKPPGEKSCEEVCHAAHPAGTADFAVRLACVTQFCSDCDGSAVDPCLACGHQYCAEELITSSATLNGFLAQGCNNSCGYNNPVCGQSCFDEYDLPIEWVVTAGDCVITFCPECTTVQ